MASAETIATQSDRPPRTVGGDYQSTWRETSLLVVIGSVLLFMMTLPSFRTFFVAENFEYLGQYQTHGASFWRAIASPTNRIFFRPVFFTASLPWYYVLPLEPWAYHLRNYAFTVINLLLLHRVLVRMVESRRARLLSFFFFALSKIHLTTIGYINIFDATVMLMLLLTTILFFLRYIAGRRERDYALALVFCALSIFSKDYGLVIVFVVIALVACYGVKAGRWRGDSIWWVRRLSPLLPVVFLYLGLRYAIVGPLPASDPIYAPQLRFGLSVVKLLVFTSTLGNLSFAANGISGASGIGTWLTVSAGGAGAWLSKTLYEADTPIISWADILLYVGLMVLMVFTIARVRRTAGHRLLFPLIWIMVYFAPTLLTRNMQMYYNYEPLAGAAVLLGICLDRVNRRILKTWSVVIIIIGINGVISNYTSLYGWQFVARGAQKIERPLVETYRGRFIESVTFSASQKPLWQFTFGNSDYPLIAAMMKLPELKVKYISSDEANARLAQMSSAELLVDIDNNFLVYSGRRPTPASRELFNARTTHSARIMASPNPVMVEGLQAGATSISWSTGDGSTGQVYVSENGGAERLFAEDSESSSNATWIKAGPAYAFRLYAGTEHRHQLAEVKVAATMNHPAP